jgi:predicted aconitase
MQKMFIERRHGQVILSAAILGTIAFTGVYARENAEAAKAILMEVGDA